MDGDLQGLGVDVIQMEVSLGLPSTVVPQRDLHKVSGSMNTAHLVGFASLLK